MDNSCCKSVVLAYPFLIFFIIRKNFFIIIYIRLHKGITVHLSGLSELIVLFSLIMFLILQNSLN